MGDRPIAKPVPTQTKKNKYKYVYALNGIRHHDATRRECRPIIKSTGWS